MTPTQKLVRETEEKMKRTLEASKRDFAQVRTGRASPSLVEGLFVDYYNTPTPLKQLATISAPETTMIAIHPWDPTAIVEIEKAILKSDIGITPNNDGKIIRLNIPSLTQERRDELIKVTKKMAEDGRVSVRTVRRDANEHAKKIEKDGLITEDEMHKALDDIQKLTDKYIAEIDKALREKDEEIAAF
ncbi:MAG: ribosome recycling factor [Candidatus Omnitrophica bacterium]|nr:ribosome recycling factor [Candidatus Omnitrophota bacterium]